MMLDSIIRAAEHFDHHSLSELLENNMVHRHLEWRDPLSWIGHKPFLVLEHNREIVGALACPPDPPGVAWVRLFASQGAADEREIWRLLWVAAASELASIPGIMTAAIVMVKWMAPLLEHSGFSTHQELVLLERSNADFINHPKEKDSASIRPMATHDLDNVTTVDATAFHPLWQNTYSDLARAYSRAYLAAVAEMDRRVVGYHISTRTAKGIHLARLAVLPEWQGQGIGRALVDDLISQAGRRGIHLITVNTQSDNAASLALYREAGFLETGERFPVYTRQEND